MAAKVRVLGLGNEILADDALGLLAARQLADLFPTDEGDRCGPDASRRAGNDFRLVYKSECRLTAGCSRPAKSVGG